MNLVNYQEQLKELKTVTHSMMTAVKDCQLIQLRGKVVEVKGSSVMAVMPNVQIGELCELIENDSPNTVMSEVVGFNNNNAILASYGDTFGISSSTQVRQTGKCLDVLVGDYLLGQVIDGFGRPFKDISPSEDSKYYRVHRDAPSPLSRGMIDTPMPLGIKAIDGLLTCGIGQRMGVFSAAGVGKSSLMAQIINGAQADVIVLALIGERGREVKEFIEKNLGEEGMKRAVVVVSTSDRPAIERSKSAHVATTIAEYFRDQGKNVLLLMDSITRFARAQREIGLAAGEPVTRRGYPVSVFSELNKLIERTGKSDIGSITAIYTVLVEGDDMNEPVADEVRATLDGHIVLSRKLAAENHFPAIDILNSASRVMAQVISDEQLLYAGKIKELIAKYIDVDLLLKIGEYQVGFDDITDKAIAKKDYIKQFLQQNSHEYFQFDDINRLLMDLINDY